RVGQAPVAVDEGPARLAGGVTAAVAMAREVGERLLELGPERRRGVAVVVEVHLDLAEAAAGEVGGRLEEVRRVLLARVEEAVARRPSVGVEEVGGERRVALAPGAHPLAPDGVADAAPERLVVIAEREEEVARTVAVRSHRAA